MVDHRDILISDDVLGDPARVRTVLARRVDELLSRGGDGVSDLHVIRLVVRIAAPDPHAWLAAQELMPKIYWHGRGDDRLTAAVGAADRCVGGRVDGFESLRSQLDVVLPGSDARVRYFGGFRFDLDAKTSAEWQPFGTFAFTLPRFVLMKHGEAAVLGCNLLLPRDVDRRAHILEEIEQLRFPVDPLDGALPLPDSRSDTPDRDGWFDKLARALDAIDQRREGLEKIVLARRAAYEFSDRLDPITILKELEKVTANCFHFAFQFGGDSALVGATPERLFRRSGRRIWTEAVAGTRPRGETEAEDRGAVASLLASEKDQREHAYVRDSIREALEPLCDVFDIDAEASGLKLTRGWHLISRSEGLLKEGVHGSDVMRALHPTPAVGGYPTETALRAIRDLEAFDRGWYAGPVGWIGSQGAEFAVALRCGLVRANSLSLYSGAGIVRGSDAASEWDEIEQKTSDFAKVFGLYAHDGS
ncbi:MAG: isochorismate synthase [Rhodothermales bacterium]